MLVQALLGERGVGRGRGGTGLWDKKGRGGGVDGREGRGGVWKEDVGNGVLYQREREFVGRRRGGGIERMMWAGRGGDGDGDGDMLKRECWKGGGG